MYDYVWLFIEICVFLHVLLRGCWCFLDLICGQNPSTSRSEAAKQTKKIIQRDTYWQNILAVCFWLADCSNSTGTWNKLGINLESNESYGLCQRWTRWHRRHRRRHIWCPTRSCWRLGVPFVWPPWKDSKVQTGWSKWPDPIDHQTDINELSIWYDLHMICIWFALFCLGLHFESLFHFNVLRCFWDVFDCLFHSCLPQEGNQHLQLC